MNAAPQTFESTLMTTEGAHISGTVRDATGVIIAGATITAFDSTGAQVARALSTASGFDLIVPEGNYRIDVQQAGFQHTSVTGLRPTNDRPARRDIQLNVGSLAETIEVTAQASPIQTESAGLAFQNRSATRFTPPPPAAQISAARAQTQVAATAQELGDLFEYKLKDPVTIQKNRSALVPIVQSSISAEKVSVWNERYGLPRPQRALWVTNTSGLTLDGGTFSVLEEETFAGEGIFDPIHPAEKRLISYATDLALTVNAKQASDPQRVSRVTVNKGVLMQESEIREKKTYTFRNEDSFARTVVVEHPLRTGYELRGDARPVETSAGLQRFRLSVPSKQTASLVIDEARAIQTSYELSDLNSNQVELFVREKSIDRTIEVALRKIIAQKTVLADLESKQTSLESEQKKIFDDQQRLRENMKALKGSAEERQLLQRYTKQLNDQEDRLDAMKKEVARLEEQQGKEQEALDKMMQELVLEIRL